MVNTYNLQFNEFTEYIIKRENIREKYPLVNIQYLKKIILEICGKTLVLAINEKRISNELKGKTPEQRYKYFENHYCKTGIIYNEMCEVFPTIIKNLHKKIHSYENLINNVQSLFIKDRAELVENKILHKEDEKIKNIDITGDLHNGNAVLKLTTSESQLIYKPRSIKNDIFFSNIISFLGAIDEKRSLYSNPINFLDKNSYGWVEYIVKEPLKSPSLAVNYYKRVGYLLSIAYFFNISDLHFENIISYKDLPIIVDLETIFNIPIFEPNYKNNSVKKIERRITNSVYSTGMLPIASNNNQFGGDTSGILGGSFVREEPMVKNPFRDDIKLEKKIIKENNKSHIPFYINEENEKEYCNPGEYLSDILYGFEYCYHLVMKNKCEFLNYVKEHSKNVEVRMLARNTIEYATLINAARSPIYVDRAPKLFEKLQKFNDGLDKRLVKSEIKQISSISIPYFSCSLFSSSVKDPYNNEVTNLKESPYSIFRSKFDYYDNNDLELQKKLISFSIKSQDKLYKDGNDFNYYQYKSVDDDYTEKAIQSLVDIIITNAIYSESDNSVNWMSLGISFNEQIGFESLDNDVYKGISGIGVSLIEYAKHYKNNRVDKLLEIIYNSIKMDIRNYDISNEDYSFYNGIFGEIHFLLEYSEYKDLNRKPIYSLIKEELNGITEENFSTTDIIGGLPGIIIYLYNKKIFTSEIINLGRKMISFIQFQDNVASYAHGNSGIMTSLVYLYELSKEQKFLDLFLELWDKENELKLNLGWQDNRKNVADYSVYWCHGATGQLLARMNWLEIDEKIHFLSPSQLHYLKLEIRELKSLVASKGLIEDNFCLCHGIAGNILVLNYYNKCFSNNSMNSIIHRNIKSIVEYGLNEGWLCGFGNKFYSYGLMTGISGILYALIKYKKDKATLGILLPTS